ncbi:penicillin-binding protein 1C [Roseinatronobacter alkalisoli]|uniref:peptidoglycan glycosyltransferase n=1 Tax=Roseinatronobacter alkalisoli TaxID=3028235 RepID=A0ABT5T3A9_9RHOB|nr:penicillin-binding protein 1C [Roseinatronobacter sp. HJB301]MDD7969600.1 penicillin-binding protein 1C [Roseinatronobacter sp. HJB301]
MRGGAARGGAFALILALGAALWLAFDHWVATTDVPDLRSDTATEVLAHDGQLLRAFTVDDGRWRLGVAPDRVDPVYLAMLIAYEDRRFYRHSGVDPLALLRGAAQVVLKGRVVSGGSTLTMQAARLIEDGPTGTWAGKLRQIRLALALERRLDKGQILSLYLHRAPMGGNLEGVRAGSFAWFGRDPERLTLAQAALLVALPQAPALRSPDRHPERARAARARVLARAQKAGVITAEQMNAALREPVPTQRRPFPAHAPHLADRLRAAAPQMRLHRTSIDADVQAALEELAARALPRLPPQANLALLVADHQSGAIRALVGSGDYTNVARRGFVDMTQALRSPGSTLKPLVYGLAFSDGLAHPETVLNDRPASFGGYAPQNFDRSFRGPVTAREALQLSLNLPVVELTQALGPARVMVGLRQAGVTAEIPGDVAGLAIALGGLGVSLEGLVQLYAAIARGGEGVMLSATAPMPALRQRIMTPEAAWHIGDILAAAPRAPVLPDWPLAFKTGTSYGHRDAIAIGYDGRYVVGVWIGRADGVPVPGIFGGDVAAPVLFDVFARLGPRPAPLPPAPPGALVVAHADLPAPLRHFGQRAGETRDAPQLAFPPDGAVLISAPDGLVARVERGRAPFTWFANDAPVLVRSHERSAYLPLQGPGFVSLSVVDADGHAARAHIELR